MSTAVQSRGFAECFQTVPREVIDDALVGMRELGASAPATLLAQAIETHDRKPGADVFSAMNRAYITAWGAGDEMRSLLAPVIRANLAAF